MGSITVLLSFIPVPVEAGIVAALLALGASVFAAQIVRRPHWTVLSGKSQTERCSLERGAIPAGTPRSNPPEFRARQGRKICLYLSVEVSEIQAHSPSQTLVPGINGFVPQRHVHHLDYRNIYANDPPLLGNLKIQRQLDSMHSPIRNLLDTIYGRPSGL